MEKRDSKYIELIKDELYNINDIHTLSMIYAYVKAIRKAENKKIKGAATID